MTDLLQEARDRLFGFTGGGEEEDQPTFAAALDDYARLLRDRTRTQLTREITEKYRLVLREGN